jgi:hypothetical protein
MFRAVAEFSEDPVLTAGAALGRLFGRGDDRSLIVTTFGTSDTNAVESHAQRGESRDIASKADTFLATPSHFPSLRAGALLQPKRGIGSEGRLSWISPR